MDEKDRRKNNDDENIELLKKVKGSCHVWNQVKIGGKWFNVDLTSDSFYYRGKTISFDVLRSDKEFSDRDDYVHYRVGEKKCSTIIEELIKKYDKDEIELN